MEPLTLCDGTPQWLQNLFSTLPEHARDERAFILTLVVLIYESGFYLLEDTPNITRTFCVKCMKQLPSVVKLNKSEGSYKLGFSLYESTQNITFVAVPLKSILLVNLIISNVKIFSLSFEIDDFIHLSLDDVTSVKNHRKLSSTFKNFVNEVKSFLIDDVDNVNHILHLPIEIISYICEYLLPREFIHFGRTCKTANALLQDEKIWKSIAKVYFPSRNLLEVKWKDFVMHQFQVNRHVQRSFYEFRPSFNRFDTMTFI